MRSACSLVLLGAMLACTAPACSDHGSTVRATAGHATRSAALLVAPYRAPHRGTLPPDGPVTVGTVHLPAGHRVTALIGPYTDGPAVAWGTNGPVPHVAAVWSELRRQFPETGLWPLISDTDAATTWDAGELATYGQTDPGRVDLASTLRTWWTASVKYFAPADLAPVTQAFPGLAPTATGPIDEGALDRLATEGPWQSPDDTSGRIALVPVERPADVVWAIGWDGPVNSISDEGQLAGVLRSWEDRFGAEPVWMSADGLFLAVRRPPTETDDALRVAGELLAVCPDCPDTNADNSPVIPQLAAEARGHAWGFWWD